LPPTRRQIIFEFLPWIVVKVVCCVAKHDGRVRLNRAVLLHEEWKRTVELRFVSQLPKSFFDELNSLFFFNPNQALYAVEIIHSIETFGTPKIIVEGDNLRLVIGDGNNVQALFGLLNRGNEITLCGVIAYTRTRTEIIDLIHVALKEEYSLFGAQGSLRLLIIMMAEMKKIARKIRGVRAIYVTYAHREITI